jgi:hypothetical protein
LNLIAFILYAYITIKELVCHWQSEFQYSQTFLCLKSKQTNNLTTCTSSYPKKCFFFQSSR